MLDTLAPALLIMTLRMLDVSIGTVKTIFVIEGRQIWAPSLGFIEATVYVIAASLVFTDLGNPYKIAGFGLGFGTGTALGMVIAQRLGLGSVTMRIFAQLDARPLVDELRAAGFRLTTVDGVGRDGPVTMINLVLRKRNVTRVLDVARPWLGYCFVTLGDEPLDVNNQPSVVRMLKQAIHMPWVFHQRQPHP